MPHCYHDNKSVLERETFLGQPYPWKDTTVTCQEINKRNGEWPMQNTDSARQVHIALSRTVLTKRRTTLINPLFVRRITGRETVPATNIHHSRMARHRGLPLEKYEAPIYTTRQVTRRISTSHAKCETYCEDRKMPCRRYRYSVSGLRHDKATAQRTTLALGY